MNNLTIAGNVGRDAEVKSTQSGDDVASFSVAVNDGKDKTTWFDCSLWGDRARKLAPYITKGSKITVSGAVSAREYQGKAYLQVRVSQVTFMSSREDREASKPSQIADQRSGGGAPAGGGGRNKYGDLDDKIPF